MSRSSKAILGFLAIGAVVTCGVSLVTTGVPNWMSLSQDKDFFHDDSPYGEEKFGKNIILI